MEVGVMGWNELGVVGTIYEEEEEEEDTFSSSSSTIPSPEFTPSPTPCKICRRNDPDVVIHVQDSCFRLHKEALIARSAYFRLKLSEFPEITLSLPLNITAPTFSMVAEFCYGTQVAVTPYTVAALRTAAELLGMTDTNGLGDRNLQQITEEYFSTEVAVNEGHLSTVLRSCFSLMPEAETAASLVSRCIEALSLTSGDDGDLSCLDGVKSLHVDDFQMILGATSQWLTDCHDLLYRIVDIYLKENIETLSDDQKIKICNYIDCSILSPKLLMHAVQNLIMPLRFVVQAMFLQQLNTRHIISAANHHLGSRRHHEDEKDPITLGAILERDAALRETSHLKAVVSATSSRIESLEKELRGMRKLVSESESAARKRVDSGRASSFRFSSDNSGRVERGERGSVSALSLRNVKTELVMSSYEDSSSSSGGCPKAEKSFGRRLMRGLKSAFGLQRKKREGNTQGEDGDENDENNNIVIIKKDQAFHRRTSSQS
ncbi:hypothetical protein OROGR_023646 [Orobanche gracilis]